MRFQLKREWVIPTVVGVVSFVTGTGLGYGFKRFRDQKIEARIADSKISESRAEAEQLDSRLTERSFEFDEHTREYNQVIQQGIRAFREVKEYFDEVKQSIDPAELMEARHSHPANGENVVNIFPKVHGDDEDWNYEQEVAKRTPDKPYIIHRDEYYDNENDDRQSTLTYYEGDNILCDSHDTPVYDVENVVGFLQFGHGSQDPNICYVRNERLMAEYEVLRDGGYYQVEVLGEALEEKDIKHSKQLPKFRLE
jgi:hypothetical protein